MTLREALTKARDALPQDDTEAREWIEALLAQRSDRYGTLCDEIEIAIHG